MILARSHGTDTMCTLRRPLAVRVLPRPRKILKTADANYTTARRCRRRDIYDIGIHDDGEELPSQFELDSGFDVSIATASASEVCFSLA